jgi:hypothetical protein
MSASEAGGDSVIGEIDNILSFTKQHHEDGMGGECSRHRKFRNCVRNLIGKFESNRTLAVIKHGCEDNIKNGA